ncbi:Cof-type HAD-IIB family hydrolase [Halobacillus sp. A1]|uniref:Cof-type HAD-IIB family hydrolase n=1 Tax=Halobacillus sp. A1 TaxID=2880262 RepID=UPI0020A6278A|nr:HAD family hydrolase [Halobacillus sp. A1]MCP3032511.1 Cof-type HAD-IIB family hydrolase [Halobacillus sp. A1]
MNPKAIALDMDGTLLNSENKVTKELLSLLQTVQQEKGIRIFIASGRTRLEIEDVLPSELKPDGIVSANGMGCYRGEEVLFEHKLNPDLVRLAVDKARENELYYEVHPHKGDRIARKEDKEVFENIIGGSRPDTLMDNEYLSRKQAITEDIRWVDNLSYEDNVKVYFFSMDTVKIKEWKQTLETFKESYNFSAFSSTLHNAEIMESVSKAVGISKLLEEYHMAPGDLMAIGDGENDLPMLELAGCSVAMQNAEDVVKRSVDEVTPLTYEQNGLYSYLSQKLF